MKFTYKSILAATFTALLVSCGGSNPMKDVTKGFDLDLIPYVNCSNYHYTSGYLNHEGEEVVSVYTGNEQPSLSLFCDNLAYVNCNDFTGFINKDGNLVVDLAQYRKPMLNAYFSDGLYLAYDDSKNINAFNEKGEIVWEAGGSVHSQLREGYALWSPELHPYKLGLINRKGEVVFEPVTDGSSEDREYIPKDYSAFIMTPAAMAHPTYYPIFSGKGFKYFLDASTGEHLLEGVLPEIDYTFLAIDMNDRIVVREDRKYGLMDLKGEWVVEPIYNELQNDGKWYVCCEDGLYGWIDKNGKEMIPLQLEDCYSTPTFGPSDWCRINNNTFIDRKGEVVLKTAHDALSNFIGDRCLVKLHSYRDNEIYSWMDRNGDLVGPEFPSTNAKWIYPPLSRGMNIRF